MYLQCAPVYADEITELKRGSVVTLPYFFAQKQVANIRANMYNKSVFIPDYIVKLSYLQVQPELQENLF